MSTNVRPIIEGLIILVAVALGVVAFVAMVSCTPREVRSAKFAAELEACMQTSANCADYVACQHAVQTRYGQPLSGKCVVDGGAP